MVDNFKKELAETARKICTPGKGILAADESEGTIGKKFVTINVENNNDNRQAYRELLFTTPGIEQYVSGVILFSETASKHGLKDGTTFIKKLDSLGILSGIKVDKGLQNIPGTADETSTKGLDSLDAMTKEYYALGCRFAKWRATLKIAEGCPSDLAIKENAWGLARYAAICQQNGLVPIVEPEILSDGEHDISVCQKVTEKVVAACCAALQENNIYFEGCLLKPSMVIPGKQNANREKVTPKEIGERTCVALSRSLVPAMVGVTFLSGGMSEEEASLNLNAVNQVQGVARPWFLTFSYGRALQNTVVKTWAGKPENVKAAQDALLVRAKANSEAQLGKYEGSKDGSGKEDLYVANYKY